MYVIRTIREYQGVTDVNGWNKSRNWMRLRSETRQFITWLKKLDRVNSTLARWIVKKEIYRDTLGLSPSCIWRSQTWTVVLRITLPIVSVSVPFRFKSSDFRLQTSGVFGMVLSLWWVVLASGVFFTLFISFLKWVWHKMISDEIAPFKFFLGYSFQKSTFILSLFILSNFKLIKMNLRAVFIAFNYYVK